MASRGPDILVPHPRVGGGGWSGFWAKNHVSEIDFSKISLFFDEIHENPAFHTHFVDFGGVGTNETGWKPQNKENSSEIKGFGRFLGGEKLDFDDFHEFGRKSVLTAPKWSEKRQEFKKNNENAVTTQNRA